MADKPGFLYDVFISHSAQDQEWVEEWLLPRLEKAGLKVALPARDFIAGKPKLENAEYFLQCSRRTIVVLTPDWLNSEWNAFDALLLRSSDPAARRRRMLPVLLKPCELPEAIAALECIDLSVEKHWQRQIQRLTRDVVDTIPAPLPGKISDLPGWIKWLRHYRRQMTRGAAAAIPVWLILALTLQIFPFQPRLAWHRVGGIESQEESRHFYRAGDILLLSTTTESTECNTTDTGLWRSTDQGVTWQPVAGDPLLSKRTESGCIRAAVHAFASGYESGKTVIYATTTTKKSENLVGLLRSDDLGATWKSFLPEVFQGKNLYQILVLQDQRSLLVSIPNSSSLYLLPEGATSLNPLHAANTCAEEPERTWAYGTEDKDFWVLSMLLSNGHIYVGTNSGLYASIDGNCWDKQDPDNNQEYYALVENPENQEQLVVITRDSTKKGDNHFIWIFQPGQGLLAPRLWSTSATDRTLFIDPGPPATWYTVNDIAWGAKGSLETQGMRASVVSLPGLSVIPLPCIVDLTSDIQPGPPLLLAMGSVYRLEQGNWFHRIWP